ncbi:hypothetical protein GCM10022222_01510 [Amycolatopsis ultiminotia]|uniref:OmpR/PhoB-type domain-containing protein n=1 Tax=Amycolatopsis ultiminotia TaxID=543629 RepID=A0ABP6UZA5_9PSEU
MFTRAVLKEQLCPRQNGKGPGEHVRQLRAKLQPHLDPITTVRGVGYRFEGSTPVVLV